MESAEITCKGCSFKYKKILKHLFHSEACQKLYSIKEMDDLKQAPILKRYAKRRKSYDPVKRAMQYKEQKQETEKKEEVSRVEETRKLIEFYKKDSGRTDPNQTENQDSDIDEMVECMVCKYSFRKKSILKHLKEFSECKENYSLQRLKEIQLSCKNASTVRRTKQRARKYKRDKYEHDLKIFQNCRKERKYHVVIRVKNSDKNARSENDRWYREVKSMFKPEFKRMKEKCNKKELEEIVVQLENSIQATYQSFNEDINAAFIQAEKIYKDIHYLDVKSTGLDDVDALYCKVNPDYIMFHKWHDLALDIDLKLMKMAKTANISYKWAYSCPRADSACDKCISAKTLDKVNLYSYAKKKSFKIPFSEIKG